MIKINKPILQKWKTLRIDKCFKPLNENEKILNKKSRKNCKLRCFLNYLDMG